MNNLIRFEVLIKHVSHRLIVLIVLPCKCLGSLIGRMLVSKTIGLGSSPSRVRQI